MSSVRFEITNKCNLLCPSCQEGRLNYAHNHGPFQYASLDLCKQVFQRLHEHGCHYDVYLYMFCEPCLHPHLNEILDMTDAHGMSIYISSNLNVTQDWGRLLAHPSLKRLTISVSGITQDIYERGHRGGRIERVLKNMKAIAAAAPGTGTEVLVFFHQYNDNTEDEVRFCALCQHYGFTFVPSPAFFMYSPWEARRHFSGKHDATLQDGLDNTLPRLLVEKNFFMESMPSLEDIPCALELAEDIAIDCLGYTHQSCCLQTMQEGNRVAPFLDMSRDDLNAIYRNFPLCRDCKRNGYHVQFSLTPHVEYTRMAKCRTCDGAESSINTALRAFIQRRQPLEFLSGVPVHVYGAVGNAGIITLLRAQGYTLGASIDDNPGLADTEYCGLGIRPLKDFPDEERARMCVIIAFIRDEATINTVKAKLSGMGMRHVYALHEFFFLTDSGADTSKA